MTALVTSGSGRDQSCDTATGNNPSPAVPLTTIRPSTTAFTGGVSKARVRPTTHRPTTMLVMASAIPRNFAMMLPRDYFSSGSIAPTRTAPTLYETKLCRQFAQSDSDRPRLPQHCIMSAGELAAIPTRVAGSVDKSAIEIGLH